MSRGLSNRKIVILSVSTVIGMVGLAYAAVPLYDLFCRVTGFGGTTQVADQAASNILDREVTIRFDGSLARGVPLQFEPMETSRTMKVGERGLAYYEVTNLADYPVTATATYNVAPHKAGPYFMKLECFCFTEQTFAPGETVSMPVLFFVDPEIETVERLDDVQSITLSYTFFEKDVEGEVLAAAAANGPAG